MNHVILEYLSREAAYMRLAGQEQTDGNKGGMKQWGKQQSAVQTGSFPAPYRSSGCQGLLSSLN
jgi:hypothetical protein